MARLFLFYLHALMLIRHLIQLRRMHKVRGMLIKLSNMQLLLDVFPPFDEYRFIKDNKKRFYK